jgi:hypothetical protein
MRRLSFGFSLAAILAILTRVMNVTLKWEQAMLRNLGQTFDGAADTEGASEADDDEG